MLRTISKSRIQWAQSWRGRELITSKAAWQGNDLQQSDQKKTKKSKDDQYLHCHYHHHYQDGDHHYHCYYHHELSIMNLHALARLSVWTNFDGGNMQKICKGEMFHVTK